MPLYRGKSDRDFEHNIKTEYEEGKPLKQSLAIAYAMKRKGKKMAEGGDILEPDNTGYPGWDVEDAHIARKMGYGESEAKESERMAKEKHKEKLAMLQKQKRPNLYASGGFIGSYQDDEDEMDMVGQIMKQKACKYSEGGRVANSEHGYNDDELAGFSPNEFDDLVLDDDLESSYTGANSGDEIGNEREDEDQDDMISQIMKDKRMKAGRYPNSIKHGL